MKKWKARFEIFWSANNEVTVEVKANTERKAKIFAKEKVIKEYGWDMPILRSIEEVKDE